MTAQNTGIKVLTVPEVEAILATVRGATKTSTGKVEDGTRVHIKYKAFGIPTDKAIKEAQRAKDLGIPVDRFTGRVSSIWRSKAGDTILTLYVELERDHMYRRLNINKGKIEQIVILGN